MTNNPQNQRVALYCREIPNGVSLGTQEKNLIKLCKYNGWANIKIFKDRGTFGKKHTRVQLSKVQNAIDKNEIDVVCVWSVASFSRSLDSLFKTILSGVRFISISEELDSERSSPATGNFVDIISMLSELQKSIRSERTRASIATKRKDHPDSIGRPKKVVNTILIQRLISEGKSVQEVSTKLSISRGVIYSIISKAA